MDSLLDGLLRLNLHRYRALKEDEARALRQGECVATLRARILFTAGEVVELRARIAGCGANLCY